MKRSKIGIIGLGTVGGSLYNLIKKNSIPSIEIVSLCDRKKNINLKPADRDKFTTNYKDTLNSEADIIVQLIGGIDTAENILKNSIKNKKHIVTANKALLAQKGKALFNLARRNNKVMKYEAAVGGAIPIISNIKKLIKIGNIWSIKGILNGTSNYILSKMYEKNLSFSEALKLAKENGFAEEDPSLDISGKDVLHKTILLSFTAFHKWFDVKNVEFEGIENINKEDLKNAKISNKKIKLISTIEKTKQKISIKISTVFITPESSFFNIDNEYNGIQINGDSFGPLLFTGKGAGGYPTASAVLADITNLSKIINH